MLALWPRLTGAEASFSSSVEGVEKIFLLTSSWKSWRDADAVNKASTNPPVWRPLVETSLQAHFCSPSFLVPVRAQSLSPSKFFEHTFSTHTRTPCSPHPDEVVILFLLHRGERPGRAARQSYQGWRAKQCLFLSPGDWRMLQCKRCWLARRGHINLPISQCTEATCCILEIGASYGLALYNSSYKLRFLIICTVCRTSLLVLSGPKPFVGLSLVSLQPTIRHWKTAGDSKICRAMQEKYKFQFSARFSFLFAVTISGRRTTGGTGFVPRCRWGDCTPHLTHKSATQDADVAGVSMSCLPVHALL